MPFPIPLAYFAMMVLVALSNYLVQFPISDWLTWGAIPYPITFLVTELTNRFYGPKKARKVVYVGFALAVFLSVWLATPRIAMASGLAFLCSQLLDIYVFTRIRQTVWWYAPLFASGLASIVDTAIFWNVAFYGENLPYFTWALGDLTVKFVMDLSLLSPFRLFIRSKAAPVN